jgi:hypothetical protein
MEKVWDIHDMTKYEHRKPLYVRTWYQLVIITSIIQYSYRTRKRRKLGFKTPKKSQSLNQVGTKLGMMGRLVQH